jgi:hypothetical protein
MLLPPQAGSQSPIKIVGIGATTCGEFVEESKINPPVQRQYLAWMQGYMSGIVIGRPPGIDEGIDLNPKFFPLPKQLEFIRDFCLAAPSRPFADAVEELYKKLKAGNAI